MRPHLAIPALGLTLVCLASTVSAQEKTPEKRFGFDVGIIDRSASPCGDFYQYACGGWLKANPTPPEYSAWGRFTELAERNREELRRILEAAAAKREGRDAVHQKIGDYYAACMDEEGANKRGIEPLKPGLARIDALADAKAAVLDSGRLRRDGAGAFFDFGSTPDARDVREVTAEIDQGGLGLPDRDYYTNDDEKSKKLREQYLEHVTKMFQLAGDDAERAAAETKAVMAVETALAKGSQTRVERRDPEKLYNRMSTAKLAELAPSVPWDAYFKETGAPAFTSINVVSPGYFKALDEVLKTTPVADLKSYLRWALIREQAPRLSTAFLDENFRFYGTTLRGAKKLQPRWRRCVAASDQDLRDVLGQQYAEATFRPEAKARAKEMIRLLLASMDQDLTRVEWMDDTTRTRAKEKLKAIVDKIGYPDKWVDMSRLEVTPASWSENAARAARFQHARDFAKIGQPNDRTEWRFTVPTVNASYSPDRNDITFPAGILQPPFFDAKMDDGPNFGAIGVVIGHEITHGFDDQGSQFDAQGNLKNWWTERSATEFKKRAGCVEKQFSDYTVNDQHVNGKLTLGENIGDLGGVKIALAAMKSAPNAGKAAEKIDGFTQDQRFFLALGQIWCRNMTPEEQRLRINTDPHAPDKTRVNGPLSNMKAFRDAFSCPEDAAMVRKVAETCEVW